jgi:hypothetical protein
MIKFHHYKFCGCSVQEHRELSSVVYCLFILTFYEFVLELYFQKSKETKWKIINKNVCYFRKFLKYHKNIDAKNFLKKLFSTKNSF